MIYEGRELTELKFDTMQHWPEGKELLVKEFDSSEPEIARVYIFSPKQNYPFMTITGDGEYRSVKIAAELPVRKMRRVTRAECAGMFMEVEGKYIDGPYSARATVTDWKKPVPENYTRRAATLADALAGNWLPMEVEG